MRRGAGVVANGAVLENTVEPSRVPRLRIPCHTSANFILTLAGSRSRPLCGDQFRGLMSSEPKHVTLEPADAKRSFNSGAGLCPSNRGLVEPALNEPSGPRGGRNDWGARIFWRRSMSFRRYGVALFDDAASSL